MQPKYYAEAFDAAVASGVTAEVASKNLVTVAARRGHKHLLPAIARAIENRMKRHEANDTVTVTSAVSLTEGQVQAELTRAGMAHHNVRVIRRVDESLISGAIIRKGANRVDASGKSLLMGIYNRLVA